MPLTLNIGNLWDLEFLEKVGELNQKYGDTVKVTSMYGSISGVTPTARSADRIPWRDEDFVRDYVVKARDLGIFMRYTLNNSCIGPLQDFHKYWNSHLLGVCQQLHDFGIYQWTVTSPLIFELLLEAFPDDFIEVSTIVEITTPVQLARWRGVKGVCLSTSINRNFGALNLMRKVPVELSLLANEACLYRCLWRAECYNLSSHDSIRSDEVFDRYPWSKCSALRASDPKEWLAARMILPQWMSIYQELVGISNFKISFRTSTPEIALPILEAYMQQSWKGNLLDLWPQITHLAGGSNPAEDIYISSEKLDRHNFLNYFIHYGHLCNENVCGWDCEYCQVMYDLAKILKQGAK